MPTRRFCLYRRSNGVYYLKVWSNGRPVYKSTHATSRAEALKAVSRIDAVLKPRLPDYLLQQFVRDFLTHAGSVYARRTCIIYRQALGHLLALPGTFPSPR